MSLVLLWLSARRKHLTMQTQHKYEIVTKERIICTFLLLNYFFLTV
jgi:hypothetical protein